MWCLYVAGNLANVFLGKDSAYGTRPLAEV